MSKKEVQETAVKEVKTEKNTGKKGNKFTRWCGRRWQGIKGTVSELKKVSWPTFGKVMKQLGVVLLVVIIFLVLIWGADAGLGALLKVMRNGAELA